MRPKRTHDSHAPRSLAPRLLLLAVAAFGVLAGTAPAHATLAKVEVTPAEPTDCTPVLLTLSGTLPNPCYEIVGVRVSEPHPLDTLSPIPVYRTQVRVIVQGKNPATTQVCPEVLQPYSLDRRLGALPSGIHQIGAVEYVHPFPADSTTPVDSSHAWLRFTVRPDSCPTPPGCVLLGFANSALGPNRIDGCTARTMPGQRACFDVTLLNSDRVAALQTEVRIRDGVADAHLFQPVEVTATPRAEGFQVAWQAEGSTAKILLYSTTGAAIAAGRGPVLHVCYAVAAETPPNEYPIRFGPTIVSDPAGGGLSLCPTFAEITGRLCVGDTSEPACDVNGDGRSDIRDIVRMVRCILAGSSCPDSIRERSDCNRDGTVNILDVVCCVGRILDQQGGWSPAAPGTDPDGAIRLGFAGPAAWKSTTEAEVTVNVEPLGRMGGIQWTLDPGLAARVRSIEIDPNVERFFGWQWTPRPDGSVRVLLYQSDQTSIDIQNSIRTTHASFRVTLVPVAGAAGPSTLALRDAMAASEDGADAPLSLGSIRTTLPPHATVQAPRVLPARPNPFAQGTDLSYFLPAAGRADLRLYDVRGRLVRVLRSGASAAGTQTVRWDGRDDRGQSVGAGIYFVRLEASGVVSSDRILRLR
jgi:hypothetical protein